MSPSTSTLSTTKAPTFASLGVRPIVNCMGTYTIISGSRALKQVSEAMLEASNNYVHLDELMEKVGQRLAELTGAEWGYVTCGCAAALAELASACIAGADPEKMARLPDATGMKNEVIIQKGHRNSYDRAIRLAGAQMIEVVTLADLRVAISERTAMLAFIGDIEEHGQIQAADWIRVGHAHGIPCIVDAAAQRPDIPNRYLQLGADAVCYSGGKCLRGPQSAGLVLGRKDLLWAAFMNSAPHHGVARPMKVGKEEIMGMLAAVEAWIMGRDHKAEWRMWEGFLETIRASVADLPSVKTEVRQPGVSNVAPTLVITWDEDTLHCTPGEAHQALRAGEPPIAMHLVAGGLMVMPYMMELGDDAIAARRLREILGKRIGPAAPKPAPAAPAYDLSGAWELHTQYVLGASTHSLVVKQEGNALSGDYRSQYTRGVLKGQIVGTQVTFTVLIGYQDNDVRYVYTGTATQDGLSGTVTLGEYGSGAWTARRV